MKADGSNRWWTKAQHEARRPLLLARNRVQAAVRNWFADAGFIEADPPGLQISPGNETHLHAFATESVGTDGARHLMYLHTSPEFAMKKLLAAGEERLFALSHVWRNREGGPLHALEFSMLEWYRAGASYSALMEDTAALVACAARAIDATELRWRNVTCDPFAAPERVSVVEAAARLGGINLAATLDPDGQGNATALARALTDTGLEARDGETWTDLFSRLLVARIEPQLGHGRMTILDRYPICEAALARPAPDDPRFAERFEVYACGVELANGFGELTDAAEQRARFEADMVEKQAIYGEHYPIDDDFLAALEVMPEASGIALGFDRLVLLLTGAPKLDMVQWAPVRVGGQL